MGDADTTFGAGAAPDPWAGLPEDELRLALVLNGGVSLAVWMGGVALEIDRLTRAANADPDPDAGADAAYGPLLAATRSHTTVDVITGTSAGGINGAALALSQANRGADLRLLRGVWAEQGRMEQLLRRPFQGSPTALLRGDDYFLPALHRAMRMLALPCTPRVVGRTAPMDLTLTTTLLHGDQRVDVDDFGKRMPQRVHAATFRFSNVTPDGPADPVDDPFHPDRIEGTSDALALAARCTASFPFAFEPVFVPVGEDSPDPRLRPRMDAHASWARDGVVQSRYAVDGGVLANTPLSQALDAIDRRQADGPVRRAMLLVYPHAPDEVEQEPDTTDDVPSAIGSLADVFGALHGHASRSLVERVEEHNRAAAAWHGSREQLLTGFGEPGGGAVRSVYDLLEHAWPHYRHIRIRTAAAGLVDKVARPEQWSYERVRGAAESAQRRWLDLQDIEQLPYVPATFDWAEPAWRGEHLSPGQWTWGDTPARGVLGSVAAVLRSALSVVSDADARVRLSVARQEVGEKAIAITRLRRVDIDDVWLDDPYLMGLEPDQDYWTARIIAYGRAMQPMDDWDGVPDVATLLPPSETHEDEREAILTEILGRIGGTGTETERLVREGVVLLAERIEDLATLAGGVGDLAEWWAFLFTAALPGEPVDPTDRLLLRLLALDAATRVMSDGTPHGGNLPVQLAELSLKIDHPWARHSTGPTDKVAGMQLARFGGFLKQSWRMNDWTWGRLDAVTMLCQVVLNPARIRRLRDMTCTGPAGPVSRADFPTVWFDRLRDALYPGGTPPSYASLEVAARREVEQALGDDTDARLYLPQLARWAALPLQAEIIREELPILEAAIKIDVSDGAGARTRGTRFLAEHSETLMARIKAPPPGTDLLELGCEALSVFDIAGIGREELGDETGSDSLIRTISTAAGVLATVVDNDAAKVRAIKPVTSSVRGALLLPYWMIHGLASGGRLARFLASGGLVVGGVLLALSLLGVLGGAAAAAGTAGAAAVLSALAYSALKTGSLLHSVVLLAPVVPLVAYALDQSEGSEQAAATRVLVVLAVVLGLSFLARIPWPLGSPSALWGRIWREHRSVVLAVGFVAVLVLVVVAVPRVRGAVLSWVRDAWSWLVSLWDRLVDLLGVDPSALWVQAVAVVLVVAVGTLITRQQTRQLRTWHLLPGSTATYSDGSVCGLFATRWLAHPTGVAASWAPVYGTAYLLLALVIARLPAGSGGAWETWVRFTLGWFVVLGAALCLVVPVALARAHRRSALRSISRSWAGTRDPLASESSADPSDARRLLHLLLKYDLGYHYLLSPSPAPSSAPSSADESSVSPDQATALALSARGREVRDGLEV